MECKFDITAFSGVRIAWINRYIMECKWALKKVGTNSMKELIDTLWNVNNKKAKEISDRLQGINRYIMECKCHWIKSG